MYSEQVAKILSRCNPRKKKPGVTLPKAPNPSPQPEIFPAGLFGISTSFAEFYRDFSGILSAKSCNIRANKGGGGCCCLSFFDGTLRFECFELFKWNRKCYHTPMMYQKVN